MSYAGVEREYPKPCREGYHSYIPRGDCHICGIRCTPDGLSLPEAERRKLKKENDELKQENEKLKRIEKIYNREHEDDHYDPMG